MLFAHDTELALVSTAELVNSWIAEERDGDPTLDRAALDAFLSTNLFSGVIDGSEAELAAVRAIRPRLHALWTAPDADAVVGLVNDLLAETDARPYLDRHDELDWHLHVTDGAQPLAMRMGAEGAMAVADLVRADDLDRLRICAADDCESVLVDLSRNRSKRFCDTGNCGNRMHVAAYRARKAASDG